MTKITLKDGTVIVDKSDLLTICAYITYNSSSDIDSISIKDVQDTNQKIKIKDIKSIECY